MADGTSSPAANPHARPGVAMFTDRGGASGGAGGGGADEALPDARDRASAASGAAGRRATTMAVPGAPRRPQEMRLGPAARDAGRRFTTTAVPPAGDMSELDAARAVRSLMTAESRGKAKPQTRAKRARSLMADGFLKSHRGLANSLTKEQVGRIRKAFDAYASPLTESITAKDLRPLLQALGDNPTRDELQRLIILVDADGNGLIDFEEFLTLVAVRSQHKHTRAEVRDAFKMFDLEDTGVVAIDHLRHALKHLANMTDDDIAALIDEATEGDPTATHIAIDACVERIMSY
uniref:Calmodulin n=1 Tax=Bicosoecida sp. CB-2014 TaxID=1486930 RepID=A0A7S1C6V5_9STRA|mmetsp:Transcript_13099/g.45805  ORF Transcript_13099/g.45805 Transcript_13099/m.45805 type:complete len:292 (+) Transcript_13099:170-1045(+)